MKQHSNVTPTVPNSLVGDVHKYLYLLILYQLIWVFIVPLEISTKVIQCCAITRELSVFVSRLTMSHLTYSKMAALHSISQFCDPHGNRYTLPLKLTARLVFVASSESETGRRRRMGGEGGPGEEDGIWRNRGSRDVTPIKLLANQVITWVIQGLHRRP